MSSSLPVDPSASMKAAQDQEMVRRKMEIDAMRKHLSPGPDSKEKLKDACQGFESVFIQKIWEQMRKNVPQDGYLHSKQEAMYQSMYDQEFSKKMTEAGGIGLADMLYDQLAQSLGESSRTVSTGINTALPRVSATASPTSMKYAGAGGQTTEIKPLYEDVNGAIPLAQRKFELPGTDTMQGYAFQRNRFAPQPSDGLVEGLDESMLGDGLGKVPVNPAGGFLTQPSGDDLDFESISQALLAEEQQAGQAAVAEEPVARAPISVYAQAFNRRHSTGVLSAEQKRILDDAVSENLRAVNLARGAAATTASAVQGATGSRGRG